MTLPFREHMIGATRLVREGRLAEATSLLQSALRGTAEGGAVGPATREDRAVGGLLDGIAEDLRNVLKGLPIDAGQASLEEGARAPSAAAAGTFLEAVFANAAGRRPYKLFVPSGYDAARPLALVVMLHGCTQSPDDFAAGTRMNELAEEETFLVCYPAQTSAANGSRCWNWFKAEDQRRDRGEPAIVAGLTRQIMTEYAVDPTRVYVAGLSAGGALAAIMGQAYPDLYAAVGVHSGLACGAARDMPSAFTAMRQGGGHPQPGSTSAQVPAIVFHGDRDGTVNPVNGDEVAAQTMRAHLERVVEEGGSPGRHTYTRTRHTDPAGRTVVEQWNIHGAGHAWAGGSSGGSYTDPLGPDASREMWRFFRDHPGPARRSS